MFKRESSIKPIRLDQYVGQHRIKNRLCEILDNAKKKDTVVPHLIVSGITNSGRRTLASVIASELGVKFDMVEASTIKGEKDLFPYLTNLEYGSVIAIIDVEKLPKSTLRMLESSLRDFRIDVVLGKGVNARTLNLQLQQFTCVSITSHPEKSCRAVKQHSIPMEFEPYSIDEAIEVVCRKCSAIGIDLRGGQKIHPELLRRFVTSVHCSIGDAMNLLQKANNVSENEITKKSLQSIGHFFEEFATNSTPSERQRKIQEMTGKQFEIFVAGLFSRKGYYVEMTPDSGDHGIDLRLSRSGRRGVVQCKRWNGIVGEKELRDFFGAMCHENVEFGFFVAGTEFSSSAKEFSRGKTLALVDIHDLTGNPDWFV